MKPWLLAVTRITMALAGAYCAVNGAFWGAMFLFVLALITLD